MRQKLEVHLAGIHAATAGRELLTSTDSTGDSYYNTLVENINCLYKAEVILEKPHRSKLVTLAWANWYNNRRLLERLGHIPPAEAKQAYYASIGNRDQAV